MADVTITDVITPATSFDFMTLDEAKILFKIDPADTSQDALLKMLISINSEIIAEKCNRIFAKETVEETWREVENGRVFLTHWPVKKTDIQSVKSAGIDYPAGSYELEVASGKLSNVSVNAPQSSPWAQSVIVTYTGGFDLPTEAPMPLKHITWMLMTEDRMRSLTAQFGGIRQLSHKEARVAFFDPNSVLTKTLGKGSGTMQAVDTLLSQYMRFWV